jgi:ubiquitin-like-conjugating enzyme ATG10
LTAGTSYIEILRILQLPEDEDELSLALAGLGKSGGDIDLANSTDVDMTEEDGDEVSQVLCRFEEVGFAELQNEK